MNADFETDREMIRETQTLAISSSSHDGAAFADGKPHADNHEAADPAYGPYASTPAVSRPDLFVDEADLPQTAKELGARLAREQTLFNRGGPVRLTFDPTTQEVRVDALTPNSVATIAHEIARPYRMRAAKGGVGTVERVNITLPDRLARIYLDDPSAWKLRPLDGITSTPLLHQDGSIMARTGYHADTRLYCADVPRVDVPEYPAREEALAALRLLRKIFATFAFADSVRVPSGEVTSVDLDAPPGVDESAFLVALMTVVCRPSLDLAPGVVVRGAQHSGSGVGKGLLIRCMCTIANGRTPSAITGGATVQERDKRIEAALLQARSVLFLDNVNGTALRSDVLANAITERPTEVRLLGRSETRLINSSAFVAITGNALVLSEDLVRRFLVVDLDAATEDPEARSFRTDIAADVRSRHAELLSAVLTIWRWGRQNERSLKQGRPLGSFGKWQVWCRDPLLSLGVRDPVERMAAMKRDDPQRRAVAELFEVWWEAHGAAPVAAARLSGRVQQLLNPQDRGRQFVAAAVRKLVGTRSGGFVMTRCISPGEWSGDTYALRRS